VEVERALLDTGALVAFLHRDDRDHMPCVEAIRGYRGLLLTTEAVLTESIYLLGRTVGGQQACLDFILQGGAVLVPASRSSLARCRELMAEYADLPADFADATLVAVAEEMDTRRVFTLDRRGFSAYRVRDGRGFEVYP